MEGGQEPLYYVKIHELHGHPKMLAVADKELIGKRVRRGDMEIFVDERFYADRVVGESELRSLMKTHEIIVLVGNESLRVAVEEHYTSEETALWIEGVPHVQIYKFQGY
ncbi:MAG: DUF424 family protein [Desulfurococcales archaeon]|nr:DUF424 family protein [Desulfurococcales archaeon]